MFSIFRSLFVFPLLRPIFYGDVGAKSLSKNTTITILNLRDNNISDVGAKLLSKNTIITNLIFNDSMFTLINEFIKFTKEKYEDIEIIENYMFTNVEIFLAN